MPSRTLIPAPRDRRDVIGVVACEELYSEVERLAPDAAVRYVPQELHEFPVNVPVEADIRSALQGAVDDLDGPDLERLVLVYANSGGGLAGVRTTHAPLVVSRVDDGVSLFTPETEPSAMGEAKAAGTYYLTRGLVDCGVDSYKLYRAYRNDLADLEARFERASAAHPDLRVTWGDGDRFAAAVERGRELAPELVERFFHDVLGYYERVRLLDTGALYDLHHEYAATVRAFVERLSAEHGDGHDVDLSVVDGDLALLSRLLTVDPTDQTVADDEYVDVYDPGEPVE